MNKVNAPISSHHIGGRGGTGSSQVPGLFAGDVQHVYYEADTDCTEQMRNIHQGLQNIIIIPKCIGRQNGREPFHINYDPFMSSLR